MSAPRPLCRWRWCCGFVLAAGLGVAATEAADRRGYHQASIRCDGELVTVGAEAFVLLDKCGDPDLRQLLGTTRKTDVVQTGNDTAAIAAVDSVQLVTELWVYRQGRGRLARVLTLTGGIITDIRLSERQ